MEQRLKENNNLITNYNKDDLFKNGVLNYSEMIDELASALIEISIVGVEKDSKAFWWTNKAVQNHLKQFSDLQNLFGEKQDIRSRIYYTYLTGISHIMYCIDYAISKKEKYYDDKLKKVNSRYKTIQMLKEYGLYLFYNI